MNLVYRYTHVQYDFNDYHSGQNTYQLAEERRRTDICGLVIPGENHRIWTFNVVPKRVPFLERESTEGRKNIYIIINSPDLIETDRHKKKKRDCVLTSILPLRSLKMEEMTVSSSVCWTSSLDGQISHRYTSFPSEVTPAPTTGCSILEV